jgi:hypothetical protein
MLYRLSSALLALSFTTFLLVASPAHAAEPGAPASAESTQVSPVQETERLAALRDAGRYDELATLTGDAVLKRRLSELRRARFMQQRLHAQYQPQHPARESIDDRVALLEGEVVRRAGVAVQNAGSAPAESAAPVDALARAREQLRAQKHASAQSGVSQGDAFDAGSGAGGAL